MIGKLGMPELLIVLVIIIMLFGPSKISGLGKSMGEAIRGFKSAVKDEEEKPSV